MEVEQSRQNMRLNPHHFGTLKLLHTQTSDDQKSDILTGKSSSIFFASHWCYVTRNRSRIPTLNNWASLNVIRRRIKFIQNPKDFFMGLIGAIWYSGY